MLPVSMAHSKRLAKEYKPGERGCLAATASRTSYSAGRIRGRSSPCADGSSNDGCLHRPASRPREGVGSQPGCCEMARTAATADLQAAVRATTQAAALVTEQPASPGQAQFLQRFEAVRGRAQGSLDDGRARFAWPGRADISAADAQEISALWDETAGHTGSGLDDFAFSSRTSCRIGNEVTVAIISGSRHIFRSRPGSGLSSETEESAPPQRSPASYGADAAGSSHLRRYLLHLGNRGQPSSPPRARDPPSSPRPHRPLRHNSSRDHDGAQAGWKTPAIPSRDAVIAATAAPLPTRRRPRAEPPPATGPTTPPSQPERNGAA